MSRQGPARRIQGHSGPDRGRPEECRDEHALYPIISPIDGIVCFQERRRGADGGASFQTPTLFKIAKDLTKMQIDTNSTRPIWEDQDRAEVDFVVRCLSCQRFQRHGGAGENCADDRSDVVTYDVVVMVDNSDLKLKPGMTPT